MDETRFDQALKTYANAFARRTALRSLGVAGLALLGAAGLPVGGDAKKKKGKKKKKKCKGGAKKCGKTCIPSTDCCSDAECDGGFCEDGTCQCLEGSKACKGRCIPEERCCDAKDCDDGNPCTEDICNNNGTCSHPKRQDLTDCGGGKACSGGVCATPPSCLSFGIPCGANAHCCSNFCIPTGQFTGICNVSSPGQPCVLPTDCADSACVGFVCTA